MTGMSKTLVEQVPGVGYLEAGHRIVDEYGYLGLAEGLEGGAATQHQTATDAAGVKGLEGNTRRPLDFLDGGVELVWVEVLVVFRRVRLRRPGRILGRLPRTICH